MAINFPTSPSVDDTYTYLDQSWICKGTDPVIWERSAATETGNTEGNTGEVAYYDAKGSIIKGATAFYYDSTNLKVGIGTSGPDQTLGVSGDFYVSGGATFGDNIVLGTNNTETNNWIGGGPTDERLEFNTNGNAIYARTNNLDIERSLRHYGDSDTKIDFTTDNIEFQAGGTTGIIHMMAGLSADAGATFGGDVKVVNGGIGITGAGSFMEFSDGSTQGVAAIQYFSVEGNGSPLYNNAGNGIISGIDISTDDTITASLQNTVISGIPNNTAKYILTAGSNVPKLDESQTFSHTTGNAFTSPIGASRYTANTTTHTLLASIDHATSTYMGITGGLINYKILGTDILDMDTDIHAFVGISADAGATFGGDINCLGNIVLTEDAEVNIGGDTEQIIFNGGSGQIRLAANATMFDRYLTHNGDSDTRIEFQTNQITLEAGGTDYIDITSAGTNFADTDVVRPNLKDYSETALATSTKSASFNVDFESGNVQSFTFADDLTVSFTNPPASGKSGTVTLIITNGGANTTTWHANVKWPGGNAPALTASGVDIVSFMTIDAGTTIYGFVGGINFS